MIKDRQDKCKQTITEALLPSHAASHTILVKLTASVSSHRVIGHFSTIKFASNIHVI